ncbi:MAG: PKD domain-containing protein [Bacteroidetes bacterium]|nr:PKD domain-containing protein [Bacteroidota bacterium]
MGRKLLLLVLLGWFCLESEAAHLVGGDLSFSCQGNDRYNFTLTVYRDRQSSTGATHDQPAYIFIYNLDNGQLFSSHSANFGSTPIVSNNDLGDCLSIPPSSQPSIDFASYRFTNINLPLNTRGYQVLYQRCCRSTDAANLQDNSDGYGQGSTYEVIITPNVMADCGSAATTPEFEFEDPPPTQWCAGQVVTNDQSVNPAILTHVDSVVYSLCAPYEGGSGTDCINPTPAAFGGTGNCFDFSTFCSQPCSFSSVSYMPGYSSQAPFGLGSNVTIDPSTGILSVEPDFLGTFVVGICATAYLNGQAWTKISRDYSYKVFDCDREGASPPEAVDGGLLDPVIVNGIGEIEAVYLICSEFTVEFDQSSPNPLNHWWDFGVRGVDNDTSILPFPTYTFPDTGTYLITYVVNRNEPCVDTAYGIVKIFPRLVPSFYANADGNVGCFTLPFEFIDTTLSTLAENPVIAWDWDFGDGTTDSGTPTPTHTYSNPGTYTVEMQIETALGCIDDFTIQVSPEPAPVAGIGDLLNCSGEAHQFQNLSNLNGSALLNYSWDFGDGNGFFYTTTDLNPPPQTYADSGVYTIQLAASSSNGCSDTAVAQLIIADRVEAEFIYDPLTICPGQIVQFNNTTLQYYDSLSWDIDGNTYSIEDPTYTYTTPGIKPTTLTVYSNGICGDAITENITVEIGPLAYFETDSTCTGSLYQFQNLSQENGITIDEFLWDFGDGFSISEEHPTHIYENPGVYIVEVIAATSLACNDTFSTTIPVKLGITPDFTWTPDTICETLTLVQYSNTSIGGPWDAVLWEFGDDSTDISANPSHIYEEAGFYIPTLTITDDVCGVVDTFKTIEILDVPILELPGTLNICDGIIKTLQVDNPGNYIVYWSTGDSLVNSININNSYDSVSVWVNNRGCTNSNLTIVTRDCPAYLPNTFTPNGDGVNDYFGPLPNNIESFTLEIYNRWGELVYTTTSLSDPWDGKQDGDDAHVDTYVYSFRGIGLDNKPLYQFGTVSVIR